MVFINEWFPNPNGADAKGEFVELFNNGNASVSLSGWTIKTTAKKVFTFGAQIIKANGYLVLTHAVTKLTLKNTGETVSLYDSNGRLVDQSQYLGQAPSGQSYSRVYYSSGTNDAGMSGPADLSGEGNAGQPQDFAWGMPTPGAANKVDLHNGISVASYPFNVPLNKAGLGLIDFIGMAIGVSAILAALVVYFLQSHENLSKLFFGGDGGVCR